MNSLKEKLKIWTKLESKLEKRFYETKLPRTKKKDLFRQLNAKASDVNEFLEIVVVYSRQLQPRWAMGWVLHYINCLGKVISKPKSSKVPRTDGIQNRYWELFLRVQLHSLSWFNSKLDTGDVRQWFCKERTLLLQNKLFTSCLWYHPTALQTTSFTESRKELDIVVGDANDIIYGEQKEARKSCWRCRDHLLILLFVQKKTSPKKVKPLYVFGWIHKLIWFRSVWIESHCNVSASLCDWLHLEVLNKLMVA